MATKELTRTDLAGGLAWYPDARLRALLWVLAVALFGVGDLLTTATLIHHGGVEAQPALRYLFMYLPVSVSMAFAVGAQLLVAYLVYRAVDHPARFLIPLWLALYGATVVVWNGAYITSL